MDKLGALVMVVFIVLLSCFLFFTTISFFSDPSPSDIVDILRVQRKVQVAVDEKGKVRDVLVDESMRDVLMLWDGIGLGFSGNVIHH